MKKEFVPYEQALALKELGFDEQCLALYDLDGKITIEFVNWNNAINRKDNYLISASLYSQAFRWFREKYGMVFNLIGSGPYYPSISFISTDGNSEIELGEFETYEEAELECLVKLIEIVKEKS
jgi:hypothetical protein